MQPYADYQHKLSLLHLFFLLLSLVTLLVMIYAENDLFPRLALIFICTTLVLAILFNLLSFKFFTPNFLLRTFLMLISARIAATYSFYLFSSLIGICLLIALVQFIYCAYNDVKNPTTAGYGMSVFDWQLTFMRIYLGLDLIPHFTEKLFAGPTPFLADVHYFSTIGVPDPLIFVILAGLCELAGAIAISIGFFTRLGAIGITLYLLIATILGKHFSLGFIWASPGGGWEYPLLWSILFLSFATAGATKFSADYHLMRHFSVPAWIKKIMGVGSQRPPFKPVRPTQYHDPNFSG